MLSSRRTYYLAPFVVIFFLINVVSSSIRVYTEELENQRYMVSRQRAAARAVSDAKRRQSGAHIDSLFSEPLATTTTTSNKKGDGGGGDDNDTNKKEIDNALLVLLEKGRGGDLLLWSKNNNINNILHHKNIKAKLDYR